MQSIDKSIHRLTQCVYVIRLAAQHAIRTDQAFNMAATVEASWTKLTQLEPLQRSSHSIAVIGKHAYVFGGELLPRQPRDGDIHSLELTGKGMRALAVERRRMIADTKT